MAHTKRWLAACLLGAVGCVLVMTSCASPDYLDHPVDVATDAAGVTFALTRADDGRFFIARADTGEAFDIRQREAIDFDITPEGGFVVAGNGPDVVTWYDGMGSYIHRYPRQNEFGVVGGIAVDGSTLWISDAKRGRVVAFDDAFEVVDVRTGDGRLNQPGAVAPGPDGAVWVYNSKADEIVLIDSNDVVVASVEAPNRNPQETPRLSASDDGSLIWPRANGSVVIVDPEGTESLLVAAEDAPFDVPIAAAIAQDGEVVVAEGLSPRSLNFVATTGGSLSPSTTAEVLWGVRSLDANSTSTFRDPSMAVEMVETESQFTSSGGEWREVGIAGITEIRGVAGGPNGAVALDLDGRVVWLDERGAVSAVATIGGPSTVELTDVVVDPQDRAWVIDAGNARLHIVSRDGTTQSPDIDARFFGNARGIGRSPNGQVWIASTASERLIELSEQATVLQVIELPGTQPTDVVVAFDGSLWVVDGGPDLTLLHLTSDGSELGRLSLTPFNSVESPHLATSQDRLFVTNPNESTLQTVDLRSNEWTGQDLPLRRPDDSRLDMGIGVGVDDRGQIWVADSRGAAILRLLPG